ncbi:MAG: hypothetical protein RLZZ444_2725 [Pseudomonadota bacterium]|jgi:hypothetical protein
MRKRTIAALSVTTLAGIWIAFSGGADRIDPIISASTTPSESQDFTISNMQNGTACLLTRSKRISFRSNGMQAESECDAVWPGLATARNWTQNEDGTVALTDMSGQAIVTLTIGDGVDYVAMEPTNAVLAVAAIN